MSDHNHIEINDTVLMSYINAELSHNDARAVEAWLEASEENRSYFDELSKTWEMSGQINPEPVAVNVDTAWMSVLAKINPEAKEEPKVIPLKPKKSSGTLKYLIGVAAMISIVFTVYLNWDSPVKTVDLIASNDIVVQTLSDGSEITVNKSSRLSFPETFDDNERRVKLEGEAFFDVERDESKAFVVELPEDAYVKVLGTSFNINTADDDQTMTVFVNTGKVELGNEDNQVILVAGETGVLDKITGQVRKEVDETDEVTTGFWRRSEIQFDGRSLKHVVSIINEVFEEQVSIQCKSALDEPIVTTLDKDEPLAEFLLVLADIHGLQIDIVQTDDGTEYILDCDEN